MRKKEADKRPFYRKVDMYCQALGITRTDLARKAGLSHTTLTHVSGVKFGPRIDVFRAVVVASGISADWWLGLGPARKLEVDDERLLD